MGKLFVSSLVLALSVGSTLLMADQGTHAEIVQEAYVKHGYQVVALADITNNMLLDFFAGKTPHVALVCTEGDILPITFAIKGEFLEIKINDSRHAMQILKTCFIKCTGDSLFFSANLQEWRTFLEFFTGTVEAILNVDGAPALHLNLEMNQRV